MAKPDEEDEDSLTPPDAEDLLLRLAAEQDVSPLSMDSVYDPTPILELSPLPVGGEGPIRSYASVILRSVCACQEPSLTPRESIQWNGYVVVKILARIARAHPDPRVFEALVRGMAEVRADIRGETTGESSHTAHQWYPLRYAVGWLLLGELQREPWVEGGTGYEGGGGCGPSVSVGSDMVVVDDAEVSGWAMALAGQLAKEQEAGNVGEGCSDVNPADDYSKALFGLFKVVGDDAARSFFGV